MSTTTTSTAWYDDIGMDEVDDDCFHCQVMDDSGGTVAIAVGATAEECEARAKLIAQLPALLQACRAVANAGPEPSVWWMEELQRKCKLAVEPIASYEP